MKRTLLIFALLTSQAASAEGEAKDLYATLKTQAGDIVVRLFPKDAPKTVENFVGLAKGTKAWVHPETKAPQKKALYDGTIFHRVIPGYIIQGGDPLGTGYGGPGYAFDNEPQSGRRFDKPGLLAMANAGPDTNGSQFFITLARAPSLDGRYTIFGEVIAGMDVVEKIANAPRDPRTDRPEKPVVLRSVEVNEAAPAPAAGKGPAMKPKPEKKTPPKKAQ